MYNQPVAKIADLMSTMVCLKTRYCAHLLLTRPITQFYFWKHKSVTLGIGNYLV